MDIQKESIQFYEESGKIEIVPKVHMSNKESMQNAIR